MSFKKCKYRNDCKFYDGDSVCCTFLNKICRYAKHYNIMERLTDIHLSPKGIEGCLDNLPREIKS